jgi:hypothetical protein
MTFSTADISIQLLMDTTNTLQEIESRMVARVFGGSTSLRKDRTSRGYSKTCWMSWTAPAPMD